MASRIWYYAVIGLAMAWGFTEYRARSNEAEAEAAFPPRGTLLDVNGNQVHAEVFDGPNGAPDLVLIHGSSGNTRDWSFDLAPKLAQSYRVIVLDRPGLGYTRRLHKKGETLAEQAALLQAAALQLGAEKPIVLGHSYGGAVALTWALNHPDNISALVSLSAASHPWATGLTTYYKILSNPILGPVAIRLITAFATERNVTDSLVGVFAPDAVPDGYAAHFGPGLTLRRHSMRANAMQRANLLGEIVAQVPDYPTIKVPTEILHGTADTLVSAKIHSEPLAEAIPNANLSLLPGIGHMPHHAAPDDVTDAIDRAATRAGLR